MCVLRVIIVQMELKFPVSIHVQLEHSTMERVFDQIQNVQTVSVDITAPVVQQIHPYPAVRDSSAIPEL